MPSPVRPGELSTPATMFFGLVELGQGLLKGKDKDHFITSRLTRECLLVQDRLPCATVQKLMKASMRQEIAEDDEIEEDEEDFDADLEEDGLAEGADGLHDAEEEEDAQVELADRLREDEVVEDDGDDESEEIQRKTPVYSCWDATIQGENEKGDKVPLVEILDAKWNDNIRVLTLDETIHVARKISTRRYQAFNVPTDEQGNTEWGAKLTQMCVLRLFVLEKAVTTTAQNLLGLGAHLLLVVRKVTDVFINFINIIRTDITDVNAWKELGKHDIQVLASASLALVFKLVAIPFELIRNLAALVYLDAAIEFIDHPVTAEKEDQKKLQEIYELVQKDDPAEYATVTRVNRERVAQGREPFARDPLDGVYKLLSEANDRLYGDARLEYNPRTGYCESIRLGKALTIFTGGIEQNELENQELQEAIVDLNTQRVNQKCDPIVWKPNGGYGYLHVVNAELAKARKPLLEYNYETCLCEDPQHETNLQLAQAAADRAEHAEGKQACVRAENQRRSCYLATPVALKLDGQTIALLSEVNAERQARGQPQLQYRQDLFECVEPVEEDFNWRGQVADDPNDFAAILALGLIDSYNYDEINQALAEKNRARVQNNLEPVRWNNLTQQIETLSELNEGLGNDDARYVFNQETSLIEREQPDNWEEQIEDE